jgi:hypothetical protein
MLDFHYQDHKFLMLTRNDTIYANKIIEPRHDKTNIMRLRPAWIHTSLRIRAV